MMRGAARLHGKADKGKDVDKMHKAELMVYAKDVLGVETRRVGPDGNKNLWRTVAEVKKDCKAAQAKLCQPETEAQAKLYQPETENEGSAAIY